MLCVLGGDHGTGAAKTLGFDYERESAFDRLLGSSGNLERVRLASPNSTATDEWGGRAQLGATVAQLEGFPADRSWTRFITQNPLVTKIGSWFKPGFLRGDDEKKLQDFIARKETSWGRPVTDLLPGSIKDYDLFRAQKALALDKFGRSPRDVSEGFVDGRGSVAGQAIADRRIFWQRWKPTFPMRRFLRSGASGRCITAALPRATGGFSTLPWRPRWARCARQADLS